MKDFKIPLLLDFYGNLLSEKQLFIMERYYQEDLSLAEVAQLSGMTRQGVHDNIRRAADKLRQYEERLGLLSRFMDITGAAEKIQTLIKPGTVIDEKTYSALAALLDTIKNEA